MKGSLERKKINHIKENMPLEILLVHWEAKDHD
jgi:hypothetical protein